MRLFDLSAWRSHKDGRRVLSPIDASPNQPMARRALMTGGIAAAGAAFATGAKAAVTYVELGEKNSTAANTTVINTAVGGAALRGIAQHGSSANGVYGGSADGIGVRGTGGYSGLVGEGGTYGCTATGSSYGLYAAGVYGVFASGSSRGVHGSGGTGVYGQGGATGVYGSGSTQGFRADSPYVGTWSQGASYAIYGLAPPTSGTTYGVFGAVNTSSGYGVYSDGNAHVNGTLSKAAGSFRIDHPLDPERKWLQHSFVESPDMMNVYNGNVITNAAGYATVDLPDYFGALNSDFRYQLTVIGKMAQAIVDQEISKNKFRIRTSEGHVKVSWQVTGIRQDDYAKAHRIEIEVLKSDAEQGTRQFLARGTAGRRMNPRPARH